MYNHTIIQWLKSTYSAVGEGRSLSNLCWIWDVWARHSAEGETFLPTQPSFHSGIRLVPGNMVMVAIDMYGKSPLWEWMHKIT